MINSHINKVDVVIIGGGPAGLSTACHLLQLDPSWSERLIVLEKAIHPRHKLCAGGITSFGLKQLHSLGLSLSVPYVPVKTARLRYRNRTINIQGAPVFVVTRRSEFDAWFAEQSRNRGVKLIEDSPVIHLEKQDDGIKIFTADRTYLARVVVGADGSKGVVRSWLGARERPPRVARVLESVAKASGLEQEFKNQEARFDFQHLHSNLQGYFWVFPSLINNQPSLNTGVYDARVDGEGPKASLRRIMDEGLQEIDLDVNTVRLEGHPIRWFSPWNRLSNERVILVGDAAGTDPLFGEGISVSLAYGAAAAKSLTWAFSRWNFKFKGYKKCIFFSSVGRYLLIRWLIASMLSRIQNRDLFIRGVWSMGSVLALLFNPSFPLTEVYPLRLAEMEKLTEVVDDGMRYLEM